MLIRRENPGDEAAVAAVTTAAFAKPGSPLPAETTLLDELRKDEGWLPRLSLVATDSPGGDILGHVVCTRGRVGSTPVLGLGPLSVHPDHQLRGVGSALMHAVLGAADALDEPLAGLLGSPAFYRRFGFRPAADFGILAPDPAWGEFFQIRPLAACPAVLRGPFHYAAPFSRL
ncbi:GNAT family N-acetyltransferase [Streptomyces aidingensis]|uniref:Putative acetyltransferase n=1 Tax=Streptomyces aidingensis TaxID=910347 RepID=A0A1I1GSN2_9ACTN|nr:N-acetyltransferase [Streptomyces aidingensis]SFC14506.1 putative acetyltransferase [Streptomyces aidingensis]